VRQGDTTTSRRAGVEAQANGTVRLSYVIARLDRAVRRGIEDVLEPAGLTVPQFTALSVLARRAGLSNAQLARRAYITPQSMNEVVLQLERKGLLKREPDPAHRRILRARVTPKGRTVLERCETAVGEMEGRMLQALDDEGRDRLIHDLAACVHALGAGLPDLE
jgi:DNA-binding MarR family transcriptional regulator